MGCIHCGESHNSTTCPDIRVRMTKSEFISTITKMFSRGLDQPYKDMIITITPEVLADLLEKMGLLGDQGRIPQEDLQCSASISRKGS